MGDKKGIQLRALVERTEFELAELMAGTGVLPAVTKERELVLSKSASSIRLTHLIVIPAFERDERAPLEDLLGEEEGEVEEEIAEEGETEVGGKEEVKEDEGEDKEEEEVPL